MTESPYYTSRFKNISALDNSELFSIDPSNKITFQGPSFASTSTDANMVQTLGGNPNAYWGMNIFNYNLVDSLVSADVVLATQDFTPSGIYFVDLGINGVSWNDPNYATFDALAGFAYANSNNFYIGSGGTGSIGNLFFFTGGHDSKNFIRGQVDANGNWFMGQAALATNATDGFLNIPTCAGIPTGTPTTKAGLVPMIYDTTNNNLYIYNGGWKKTTAFS